MLFRMVGMLFGLFVWNSNGELRRTAVIPSPPRNSRIATILTVPEQKICVWLHRCYSYSENSSYSAILVSSKHTLIPRSLFTKTSLKQKQNKKLPGENGS
jgi:hypothetical protein